MYFFETSYLKFFLESDKTNQDRDRAVNVSGITKKRTIKQYEVKKNDDNSFGSRNVTVNAGRVFLVQLKDAKRADGYVRYG